MNLQNRLRICFFAIVLTGLMGRFFPTEMYGLRIESISETELFQLQDFSFFVLEENNKAIDVTSSFHRNKKIELTPEGKGLIIHLGEISDSLHFVYRFTGVDDHWTSWSEGYVRVSGLKEGTNKLDISYLDKEGNYHQALILDVEMRGGLFYGYRGYVIAFFLAILVISFILWLRSFFIRRDRRRTVKFLENTVKRRTNQLQESLDQREVLLKEIHHRVKNNLQVISALLEMQSSRTEDPNVKSALIEGQNRVLSIAFIHQNLYQHGDLKGVELDSLIQELSTHVRYVFKKPDCDVELINSIPNVFLDIDSAVPLGLLINELLTNSFKYAFNGNPKGQIKITIEDLSNGEFQFHYFDDGIGLPKNFDFMQSNSMGMKLIRQLSRQLAGKMQYKFEGGSHFEMNFKNLETRSKML